MKLNNQVAIVSGGAQGIGYSIAQLFSKEGAHVVVLDINDEKSLYNLIKFNNVGTLVS